LDKRLRLRKAQGQGQPANHKAAGRVHRPLHRDRQEISLARCSSSLAANSRKGNQWVHKVRKAYSKLLLEVTLAKSSSFSLLT
jgi:hypothetical protein